MSEIKPVYQSQTGGEWHDVTDKEYAFRRELSGVYKTRILYPAAAYEVLQARIKELEISAKYAEHIDATPANQRETMMYDTLVERDALKAENEALRKKVEELLVTTGMQYLDIANLKSALSAYGDPDVLADDED